MTVNEAINIFKETGIELQRCPRSFSFGNKEECEQLFYEALLATDKSITNLIKTQEHQEIIEWMCNTNGKGLALVGSCGRGKSSILMGVLPIIFRVKYELVLTPINNINEEKLITKRWAYCVDDIGVEPVKNDYGEKTFVFSDIMNDAENRLKPVFFSTNLTGMQIIERYGNRTMDRIVRLCKIVKFQGESFRK